VRLAKVSDELTRRKCLMPRIIVMPDAKHLKEGIDGTILYAEQVAPEHLDDLISSEQVLELLEGAVRQERAIVGATAWTYC
jgi:hypothetical protein